MICILKGASVFFTDLIRQIDLPLEIEFMAISSYGASTVSSGEVRMVKDLDRPILGRDVLIVEDIVDSGMTLSFLKRTLTNRGASSLRLVTLLDKPSRRTVPLSVDYSCFQIPTPSWSATGWTTTKSTATSRSWAYWTRRCTASKRTVSVADSHQQAEGRKHTLSPPQTVDNPLASTQAQPAQKGADARSQAT